MRQVLRLTLKIAIAATLGMPIVSCSRPLPTAPSPVPVEPAPSPRVAKKRAPPPEVAPVVIGSVRYEPLLDGKARGRGQNGGDLVARDAATGAELWTLRVYPIAYAPNLEADKQDVFIVDVAAAGDGRILLVTDERGRHYRVDTLTRTVAPGAR
jgi:glucose/arabinose dehydrogenase